MNQLITYKTELAELKVKLDKKRENIRMLVENHGKITRMFERHMKGCNREEVKGEEYWEKKFRELEHYMN